MSGLRTATGVQRPGGIYQPPHGENPPRDFAFSGITHGISVGRRQPMHRAHLDCVKEISAAGLHPVIVIGSANHADSLFYNPLDNPLDETQQREQIAQAMQQAGIQEYSILTLEDKGDTDRWTEALATLLRNSGIDPSTCVSHYRSKEADAHAANTTLQPMSATEQSLMQQGIGIWKSVNQDPSMDHVSASPFRAMDVAPEANRVMMRQDLATPDFLIAQAQQARASDPDAALLAQLPVTTLDLSLRRFRLERHLSTQDILHGKPAESLEQLLQAMRECLNTPGSQIAGQIKTTVQPPEKSPAI